MFKNTKSKFISCLSIPLWSAPADPLNFLSMGFLINNYIYIYKKYVKEEYKKVNNGVVV